MGSTEKCPFSNGDNKKNNNEGFTTKNWWPKKLDLRVLDGNNSGDNVNDNGYKSLSGYRRRFMALDLVSVKKDIMELMECSQDWWPADYGHYGPFFIRMAWHSAGTYRSFDGRGGGGTGNLRMAPLNSWPDNGNLDKARRLLWPIKQKYGRRLSWADLMIFAGNCALESMGLEPFGFGGGREDVVFESEEDVYWGPEQKWLADCRHDDHKQPTKLRQPLGAVQMGLIYVNPEGRGGNSSDFQASAADIRETFGRMAMNDEETVALIAGGHTFGKAHGASSPEKHVGPEPEGAAMEEQGLGWKNTYQTGKGPDTITSGLEGAWTSRPTIWDNGYFDVLFGYEWKQTKSPAGATQWIPANPTPGVTDTVPDAHDPTKKHVPIMFTTDLVLRYDSLYGPISKKFHQNPQLFADAFSRAWYKLTHRDMGPKTRYLGKLVPHETLVWQDPVPEHDNTTFIIDNKDMEYLKFRIVKSGLSISELVSAAWASASTYRVTDHRGGANGARIRLQPQIDWKVNNPPELKRVLKMLAMIQQQFNQENRQRRQVSLADLIVLGGCAAIERAIENAGYQDKVPFYPGRTDARLEQTDTQSFTVLEHKVDGFRNYSIANGDGTHIAPEEMLVDRAYMLTLSAVEMTVLLGGMRVMNANTDKTTKFGVFTESSTQRGAMTAALTNDFFVNLLDRNTTWRKTDNNRQEQRNQQQHLFEGYDTRSGRPKWIGTRVDLVFGSNSQLRAISETYACDDSKHEFVKEFVKAWNKVMNLDRFDLSSPSSSFSSESANAMSRDEESAKRRSRL